MKNNGTTIIAERAAPYGINALSDRELLTIHCSSEALAALLIEAAGSMAGLKRWAPEQYMTVKGIGKNLAYRLATIFAINERAQDADPAMQFDDAAKIARYMRPICERLDVEKFWVFCLNRHNRLIKRVEVTSGTATNSLVHGREVFRAAIQLSAVSIIAVHNHPSGDPAPSRADIQVTRQLREAAKVIGIDLIDHIIVGNTQHDPNYLGHYSFNDAGLI